MAWEVDSVSRISGSTKTDTSVGGGASDYSSTSESS